MRILLGNLFQRASGFGLGVRVLLIVLQVFGRARLGVTCYAKAVFLGGLKPQSPDEPFAVTLLP